MAQAHIVACLGLCRQVLAWAFVGTLLATAMDGESAGNAGAFFGLRPVVQVSGAAISGLSGKITHAIDPGTHKTPSGH